MKTDLVTKVERIGPKTATLYLENGAPNRSINAKVVKRYADAMTKDRWKLTHQGIAFDEQGRLVDGQHRLSAIVASGKTVEILVSRYQTASPMAVLDSGNARSPGDRVELAGIVKFHGKEACSILSAMLTAESGCHFGDRLQDYEIEALYVQEKQNVNFVIDAFPIGHRGQWNSIIRGAFAYCHAFAPNEVKELAAIVRDMHGYKRNSAAHQFVIDLADRRFDVSGSAARERSMARCLWLIRAHVENRSFVRVVPTHGVFDWAIKQRAKRNLLMIPIIRAK